MGLFTAIREVLGLVNEECIMREQDMKSRLTKQLQYCLLNRTSISKFTGAIYDGLRTVAYEFILVPGSTMVVCTFTRDAVSWQERLSSSRISDWIVRNNGYLSLVQQITSSIASENSVIPKPLEGSHE